MPPYLQLATALGLGLLVGFQREWTKPHVAGLRTFALVSLLGALAAQLGEHFGGGWPIAAGWLAVAAMVVVGSVIKVGAGEIEPGLTTQAAALVMYGVGAAVVAGWMTPALLVTGVTALLLHFKEPMHAFVRRLGERDVRAIIQLVLVALVILPVLPNEAYGPYGVLNPFEIWLMVALIVGISVVGYLLHKFVGGHAGIVVGGLLGGVISSTGTTVSYARRSREQTGMEGSAAVVIVIASSVVFVRILVEVLVVAPAFFPTVAGPMLFMLGVLVGLSAAVLWRSRRQRQPALAEREARAELKAAIVFGLLYALVAFVVAAVRQTFGSGELYIVASVSGLAEINAITLSTARLASAGRLEADLAWRMILLAALTNLTFKIVLAGVLGGRQLLARLAPPFALAVAAGLTVLLFWPAG